MTSVSRLIVSTFATLSKAQLSAVSAYAIETHLNLKNANFTFKDFNIELSIETGLALKSIQNIASVARKLQEKYSAKLELIAALNATSRDELASFLGNELTKGGYSATLSDIDNFLSEKLSNKAQAKALKEQAAAAAAAAAAATATATAPTEPTVTAPTEPTVPAPTEPTVTAFDAVMATLQSLQLTSQEWAKVMDFAAMKAGYEVEIKGEQLAA